MKRFIILFLCAIMSSGVVVANMRTLNAVLVRVNDAIITYKDVQLRMASDAAFLARQYGSQPQLLEQKIRELEQNTVKDLVEEQLILHEFKTGGYAFPESYLEDKVEEDIRSFGDRVTLTKTLQAQGLTFESYKEKVRERLIIQLMRRQNVPQDPVVSPHKIELYYVQNRDQFQVPEQIKLRMIVLTNQPADSFVAPKRLAQEILAKLDEGADFAEMARIYSQRSQNVEDEGWTWFDRTVLRPELAEKAFDLEPGDRTDVIELEDGCYILYVEDKRAAHIKSLSEVRDEIESTLKAQESRRLREKWVERLKKKSFVRYY